MADSDQNKAIVPLDLVHLILLRATPRTLWSSRLVCKQWHRLVQSAPFIADRRRSTGGAWLLSLHHNEPLLTEAWVLLYNPLLNAHEKIRVPIDHIFPDAKNLLCLKVTRSDKKNCVVLRAWTCGIMLLEEHMGTWDPVTGLIESDLDSSTKCLDIVDAWCKSCDGLMAVSADCVCVFRRSEETWQFMGEMPHDMRQAMGEMDHAVLVAAPGFFLIVSLSHSCERYERVALFHPRKDSWTWVDNIWHTLFDNNYILGDLPLVIGCL